MSGTRSQKMKVTVSTVEEQNGEDYTIKVKVKHEKLEGTKPLADSSVQFYEHGMKTWLAEHRKMARANAGRGEVKAYSHIYYKQPEKAEPVGNEDPKEDGSMTLVELRAKYPAIKATSKVDFLIKVEEAGKTE